MKIKWEISNNDIKNIKKVIADNDNLFVQKRYEKNIQEKNIEITKNAIMFAMLACLLTSQQRSGPNSDVGRFLNLQPFPITYEASKTLKDKESWVKNILISNNLKRYVNRISSFYAFNIQYIEENEWELLEILGKLNLIDSKEKEREVSDSLANDLKGFGPKQSRNFLQMLGLAKHEIPIDSRITNWLNEFGFPVTLNSTTLADTGYYHFVLDGIQELCSKVGVYPCILDAAIFSSYDNGEWTEENNRF